MGLPTAPILRNGAMNTLFDHPYAPSSTASTTRDADATMHIGPKSLTSIVRVTEWVENERLDVVFRYRLPGGIAGKALGAAVEPIVGQAIRHTESTLRSRLEAAG